MNAIQRSEADRRVKPVDPGRKRRIREDDERDFAEELARRQAEGARPPADAAEDEPDGGELPADRLELSGRAPEEPPATPGEDAGDAPPASGRRLDLIA